MREDQIQLVAFRNAELDSERLRIFGVIGFFAIFMLITVVRAFVIRTASGTTSWRSLILAVVVIGYELWMLSKVQCALRASAMFSSRGSFPRTERHALPSAFSILSTPILRYGCSFIRVI
jgi:cytosine/uracil/thiamine/allantoin permease